MIDVVIPTKNSGQTLDLCIRGIKNHIPYGRIIVIDDYSEDDTLDIAQKHECFIVKSRAKYSLKLRQGAWFTKGQYFMIVDSDVIVTHAFKTLFKHLDSGYAVLKGVTWHWFKPPFDALSFYMMERSAEQICGLEAVLLSKKEFLEHTKHWGDDSFGAGGDLNLFHIYRKNSIPMLQMPVPVSIHISGDWKRLWRQALWYAKSYVKRPYLPIRETNRNPLKSLFRAMKGSLKYKNAKLFAV
ncbi:MAG: glycosyltransferase family 2 protein, partial [Candidatus Hodarchaeota archaeon]